MTNSANSLMSPPSETMRSSDLPVASSGIINLTRWIKAVELDLNEADGVIEVHPVNNSNDSWYKMPISSGSSGRNSCLFDKIRTSGTTVDMSKVTFFPYNPV